MLDIQFIRDNPELVKEKAKQKQVKVDVDALLKEDDKRRNLLAQIEQLRHERNDLAAAAKNTKPSSEQIQKGRAIKERLSILERELEAVEDGYHELLEQTPNIPTNDTPVGSDESGNQVVKTVGEIPKFTFKPKNDAELGAIRDYIDKERAAKVAGTRFVYLKGDVVRLQFALIQFVMDLLTDKTILRSIIEKNNLQVSDKPFIPVLPPPMVQTGVYKATARLRADEMTYKIQAENLWLNASAEHSLSPMYMNEILPEEDLPIRYLGYATSFRREAGSYGKDMEGIFRLHHFDKLEMESFTTAETSYNEHLFLIAIQEYLVQQLNLPYRVLLKCTADIGDANARGVDIEVWLPSQQQYRETHTADYMTDYQARRLKTRVRRSDGKIELAHTNDATAFALGRTLKAIMENYQNEDGSIRVPEVLKPYLLRGK